MLKLSICDIFWDQSHVTILADIKLHETTRCETPNCPRLATSDIGTDLSFKQYYFLFQVLYDPLFLKGDLVSSTGNGRLLIQNDTLFIEDAYKGFPQEVLTKLTKNEVEFQLLMLPYTSVNSLEKFLDVIIQVQVGLNKDL